MPNLITLATLIGGPRLLEPCGCTWRASDDTLESLDEGQVRREGYCLTHQPDPTATFTFVSLGPRGEFLAFVPAAALRAWIADGYAHTPHEGERSYHRHDVCTEHALAAPARDVETV